VDGVGFVALTNSDGKYYALHDIQKRVYRDALGFQENADIVKYANPTVAKLISG
jgi:hypothetical protein